MAVRAVAQTEKMKRRTSHVIVAMLTIAALGTPGTAFAYVGPGAGITVIGAALAFLASIVLAVVGFVWYPIKRLMRAITARRTGRPQNHPATD
jgi:membrane protein implicated in regulation of membrane protease activity